MKKISPLIVALDVSTSRQAESWVKRLGSAVDFYKIGMKLFTHEGPEVVRLLKRRRKKVFLDLKFHDIPNTVAEACREATALGVDLMTVHTSGGLEMMRAAKKASAEEARRLQCSSPGILGVTVLTSMNDLSELGISRGVPAQVLRLAGLAAKARLDGVVCSPLEIALLRKHLPAQVQIITPGVRPMGSARGDQKRVKTPEEAYRLGANALVVGRPILQAKQPLQVVRAILGAK